MSEQKHAEAEERFYRQMWASMEERKEALELRISELEDGHHKLVGEMASLAQEARRHGIRVSRMSWCLRRTPAESKEWTNHMENK